MLRFTVIASRRGNRKAWLKVGSKAKVTLQMGDLLMEQQLRLIDVNGLAAITGLSIPTIWRHHSNGVIPTGVKIGRSVRWRVHVIEKWLDDGCPVVGQDNDLSTDMISDQHGSQD